MRLAVAAALAALSLASPAFAQTPTPRQPTISVMGTGEAELKPDFATIVVMVETEGDAVPKVVAANKKSSDEAIARIEALGVKKDDVRTQNFQVFETPIRTDKNGNEIKVPKFTAQHRLRIKLTNLDEVGRIAGEILSGSNMLFQSVSFGLERQEQGGDAARRAAVKDARRQAELYADAAGVSLGKLLEIGAGSAQPYTMEATIPMGRAMAAKTAPEAPIVPPATLRYSANIQMVWEIAERP
ncbi:SIMPL domain-containing protein [Microvirga sp. Mcv34]|uniref:SIMPL domain-containing protein n=1 Tax=Microvirga sp. Mcv34 TaxID=2926016 RepID=UPI0021CA2D6F|nr:SIMPL domain-containing protein [Microvirga sp. Mcv34]